MKRYISKFKEDEDTIEDYLIKHFDREFALAIKKGYEGILWNSSIEKFLNDFYGTDILLKVLLVLKGNYSSWSNVFKKYYANTHFIEKYKQFLIELYFNYNMKTELMKIKKISTKFDGKIDVNGKYTSSL